MALSTRFTTDTATQAPPSPLPKWLLLILGIGLLPAALSRGVRSWETHLRSQTNTAARTVLQASDQTSLEVSLAQGIGLDAQANAVDAPEGSYTLVTSQQLFKDALTATDPEKRIRLPPNTILRLCEGQTIARGSHVIVDCQGSTFDLRCSEWFHLDNGSRVELYRCHVLWPPAQDFSGLQVGTQLLRVENDAALEMHGGSFSIVCEVRCVPLSKHRRPYRATQYFFFVHSHSSLLQVYTHAVPDHHAMHAGADGHARSYGPVTIQSWRQSSDQRLEHHLCKSQRRIEVAACQLVLHQS